jgi:hypothetical protein
MVSLALFIILSLTCLFVCHTEASKRKQKKEKSKIAERQNKTTFFFFFFLTSGSFATVGLFRFVFSLIKA